MEKISDPFDQSLYVGCNLAYLQYFEDGNKRTSRVFQNAVLMANGLPPVLFSANSRDEYIAATLYYYEHGDYAMHRCFTLDAYDRTYLPPVEQDPMPECDDAKPDQAYFGKIVSEHESGYVIQDVGRIRLVGHHVDKINIVPEVGDVVKISYNGDGKGRVESMVDE